MILTCPSCRTRYQTDGAQFKPPGRNVRCAKCGQVWYQAKPEPETEVEPEPVLAPPSVPPPSKPMAAELAAPMHGALDFGVASGIEPEPASADIRLRSRGTAFAQAVGWLALIGLIGAIGWSTIQYRETIAGLWPQSASLYSVLGLPVNVRGITLTNIAYKQEYEDGQQVLSVTGKIVNVSKRDQVVPEIRVVLLDNAKHELYHWTFDAGIQTLKPGTETPFMTRLSSPPAEARDLNVRFVDSGETR
ncbi:MAG TPA: DUF3426 domain-containing protein [Micropepsaceae bacterium]